MIDFLVALLLDFLIGDPYCFPHPVKLMGKWIAWEEKTARSLAKDNASLKKLGGGIVLLNLILSFFLPFALLRLLRGYPPLFHIVNTYLLYTCIAAGCLQREAMKIYRALSESLDKARYQLSFIVGRETKNLEEKEVIRATVNDS